MGSGLYILVMSFVIIPRIMYSFDSKGKEFILGFLNSEVTLSEEPHDPEIFITTVSNTPAEIEVSTPLFNASWIENVTVTRDNVVTVKVPHQIRGSGSDLENKGIYINSTQEVEISCVNMETYSTDGFLALPLDSLGTDHWVATWMSVPEIMVVATEDSTAVNVTFLNDPSTAAISVDFNETTYTKGDTLSVMLNKYQSIHLAEEKTSGADFTGTRVASNKPVSVFSGNYKTKVEDSNTESTADHMIEQVPSVTTLGRYFVTINTPGRSLGDFYRIIASEKNTTVTIPGELTRTITAPGYWIEFEQASTDLKFIQADKPVLVALFGKTAASGFSSGDPSMSFITPLPQYQADYTFSTVQTLKGRNFTNYLSIIARLDHTDELYLDDVHVANQTVWRAVNGSSTLVGGTIQITHGSHSVYHTNPINTFMAYVFGNAFINSYAYTAGMRLGGISGECHATTTIPGDIIDNDCDRWLDEELANGIDDDGDGLIDEDLSLPTRRNGVWENWSAWGACFRPCGFGTQNRTRACDNPAPVNNGRYCAGIAEESQSCDSCAAKGTWESWMPWSKCEPSCGPSPGSQSRSRACDLSATGRNDSQCIGQANASVSCTIPACLQSPLGSDDTLLIAILGTTGGMLALLGLAFIAALCLRTRQVKHGEWIVIMSKNGLVIAKVIKTFMGRLKCQAVDNNGHVLENEVQWLSSVHALCKVEVNEDPPHKLITDISFIETEMNEYVRRLNGKQHQSNKIFPNCPGLPRLGNDGNETTPVGWM